MWIQLKQKIKYDEKYKDVWEQYKQQHDSSPTLEMFSSELVKLKDQKVSKDFITKVEQTLNGVKNVRMRSPFGTGDLFISCRTSQNRTHTPSSSMSSPHTSIRKHLDLDKNKSPVPLKEKELVESKLLEALEKKQKKNSNSEALESNEPQRKFAAELTRTPQQMQQLDIISELEKSKSASLLSRQIDSQPLLKIYKEAELDVVSKHEYLQSLQQNLERVRNSIEGLKNYRKARENVEEGDGFILIKNKNAKWGNKL